MAKYKIIYTPSFGLPRVTKVIEADSKEEAATKLPNYYRDLYIVSIVLLKPDKEIKLEKIIQEVEQLLIRLKELQDV